MRPTLSRSKRPLPEPVPSPQTISALKEIAKMSSIEDLLASPNAARLAPKTPVESFVEGCQPGWPSTPRRVPGRWEAAFSNVSQRSRSTLAFDYTSYSKNR